MDENDGIPCINIHAKFCKLSNLGSEDTDVMS